MTLGIQQDGLTSTLAFIDESGHPHPNDEAVRPVLAAVCFAQSDSRSLSRQLYRVKRICLGTERVGLELKAHDLLKRSTFQRKPELHEFVESVFDLLRNLPVTIFAVTMERPTQVIPRTDTQLPRQYQYILQRVHALLLDQPSLSVVLIDGDGSQYGGLARKLERYLHRHREGQSLVNVVDVPYLVDSRFTMGIQLADMVAGAIRQYEGAELFRNPPPDAYLAAIERYYRIIREKTRDVVGPTGKYTWYGLHRMPERLHYFAPEEGESAVVEEEEAEGLSNQSARCDGHRPSPLALR